MALTDRLRSFLVLEGFSLQQLAALAHIGEERDAAAGEVLFREGDEARELIFLLEGRLELKSRGTHLGTVPALSLVGEMGVLRKAPRVATASAAVPSTYLSVSGEEFRRLTEEDPSLGRKFYQNLCGALMEQLQKNNLVVEFFQSIGK